jgi:hypothetical protein
MQRDELGDIRFGHRISAALVSAPARRRALLSMLEQG